MYKCELLIALLFAFSGCYAQEFRHRPTDYEWPNAENAEIDGDSIKEARSASINGIKPSRKPFEINFERQPGTNYGTKSETNKTGNQLSSEPGPSLRKADETDDGHIKKMADQLDVARKHVSRLSEHQKVILRQDPLVESYVFGNRKPETGMSKSKISRPEHGHERERLPTSGGAAYESSPKTTRKDGAKESKRKSQQPEVASGTISQVRFQSNRLTQTFPAANPTFPFNAGTFTQTRENNAMNDFNRVMNEYKGNGHFGAEESQYGKYFVQLPVGRFQTVNYGSEETGYNADFEYLKIPTNPNDY